MNISSEWTQEERLKLIGTFSAWLQTQILSNRLSMREIYEVAETINFLATADKHFLEANRRQILQILSDETILQGTGMLL